jgi:hypothetical protein
MSLIDHEWGLAHIGIHGIVANSVKVKGSSNVIHRGGWTKPAIEVYKLKC